MFQIIKEVRDIRRFNEILVVLFEEGFDFLIYETGIKVHIPFGKIIKKKLKNSENLKPEVRLRKTLERLGPTFIKFGQLLSVRPDLVPKEYAKELENLQDNVPSFPFEQVKEILEKEFGKKLGDIFASIEKTPIAAASISQVHKAVLKTGEKVAVKIQRPNVKKVMETDIEIMEYFAHVAENNIDDLKKFRPVRIVDEFKEWTEKELDFKLEARNAKRFYQNFKNSRTVHIPFIYDELTTERVLTLEFIEGVELHDTNEIKKRKLDFKKIIQNGFDAIMTQVFVHGIFHADPHPGNILVMKDNSIAFVDFGIVGYFDESLKNKCIDIFYGIIEQDVGLIMQTLASMGMESDTDYEELRSDIGIIIQPLQNSSISQIKISKVIEEILEIGLHHKIKIPASFVLFGKTIVTLEGVALEYDPNFRLAETSKPFIEKLIRKRTNPLYVWKGLMHNMNRYRKFVEDFPEKAERALDKIQRGTIKVDIEDTDIRKLSLEIDRSSNRVAYGLLISALLVTSAILINVEKGPSVLGIPLLAFLSFFFASLLVFILFVSILKEKLRHF